MHLKDKARQLPESPGVYIMKDSSENIIYIGKAKNLRNRINQYFQGSGRHSPKILRMIEGISSFDYLLADTELEALLLECRLIKDIQPMYNSQLKNHKKYVYININLEDKYPTLEVVSEKQGKGIYFGPYSSMNSVERAVNIIKERIKIRHCSNLTSKNSGCLNYQLGFCIAPCTGDISDGEYRLLIDEAITLLNGGKSDLLKQLKGKMLTAAEELDFDKAAKYRDDIRALGSLVNKQKTIRFTRCKLVVALEKICETDYKLFIIKGSRIIYKERVNYSQGKAALKKHIAELVSLFKEELVKYENNEIDKAEIDQAQIIYSYLRSKEECCYMLLPKSWLGRNDADKLKQGVEKLVDII